MAPRLIFVSYSRADSDLAVRISNELKQNSVNLWLDQLDIPAGAVWDMEIEKALGLCDCLLFIASKTSCASNNVLDEVYFALEQKKRIVPVKVDDCNIPFRIKRLQYIDISSDYSLGIENLLKTLSVEVKPVAITSEPAKGVKDESGESLDQEERLEWEWATTQNKKYAYDVYLNKYPNGKFKKKALEILAGFDKSKEEEDKVSWIKATEKNTIAGYQDYLERYPSGAFETEAQAALEELRGSKPFHDQRRRSLLKLLIISVILIIVVVLMIGDFFK